MNPPRLDDPFRFRAIVDDMPRRDLSDFPPWALGDHSPALPWIDHIYWHLKRSKRP